MLSYLLCDRVIAVTNEMVTCLYISIGDINLPIFRQKEDVCPAAAAPFWTLLLGRVKKYPSFCQSL